MAIVTIFLTASIFPLLTYAGEPCPADNGSPCLCSSSEPETSEVRCSGISSEAELRQAISKLQGYPVGRLEIYESDIKFLPKDLLQGLKIKEIYVSECNFTSLSDGEVAFEGLEDTLNFLFFHKTNFQNGWKWSQLKKLTKLNVLYIIKSSGVLMDEHIKDISHLNITTFALWGNSFKFIHEAAFSTFENLESLHLEDNHISEVKRSMFPNPATKLDELSLSGNELKELPSDLFTNMPALRVLGLASNQLTTLAQQIFEPAWGSGVLTELHVEDNPINCDCGVSWLTKHKLRRKIWGYCAEPKNLEGKEIRYLYDKQLGC